MNSNRCGGSILPFRLAMGVAIIVGSAHCANAAIVISSGITANMSCASGVCAPTASDAVLNVGDLETLLGAGDVTVTTTGEGVQATDIRVRAPLSWAENSTLSLDAYRAVRIGATLSVNGEGGLTIATKSKETPNHFTFGNKGSITFASLSSQLNIDGAQFVLVDSISALASAVKQNPGGTFALAGDYDAYQDGIYKSSPVATTFFGTFEGLGHTISMLSIDDRLAIFSPWDLVGLFAHVGRTGVVDNLRLAASSVAGKVKVENFYGYIGFVGNLVAENEGVLSGDAVDGLAEGTRYVVGGLVGFNLGEIKDSHSDAEVEDDGNGPASAGGLVGDSQGGIIEDSSATGAVVSRGDTIGGLVGSLLEGGSISGSYSTAEVNVLSDAGGSGAGGLVGQAIRESPATPNVITNCYSRGTVTAKNGTIPLIGGFGGDIDAQVSYSYSSGHLFGVVKTMGGFEGGNYGGANYDYWDTTTSGTDIGVGQGYSNGITGLTTKQLRSGLPAGFDPAIWAENPKNNHGFPYLVANPPRK